MIPACPLQQTPFRCSDIQRNLSQNSHSPSLNESAPRLPHGARSASADLPSRQASPLSKAFAGRKEVGGMCARDGGGRRGARRGGEVEGAERGEGEGDDDEVEHVPAALLNYCYYHRNVIIIIRRWRRITHTRTRALTHTRARTRKRARAHALQLSRSLCPERDISPCLKPPAAPPAGRCHRAGGP